MKLDDYLQSNFPGLILRPPLFYSWSVGIRFELGINYFEKGLKKYVEDIYERGITLFKSVHKLEDEIYVITKLDCHRNESIFSRNRTRIFTTYVKNKKLLYNLEYKVLPYIYPEDDEEDEWCSHRYSLKCRVSDLNYVSLVKALCNKDTGVKPIIYGRTYIINIKRKTIFHIYDDRGCDVIASSKNSIKDIYKNYNKWILDYDRDRINEVFQ